MCLDNGAELALREANLEMADEEEADDADSARTRRIVRLPHTTWSPVRVPIAMLTGRPWARRRLPGAGMNSMAVVASVMLGLC